MIYRLVYTDESDTLWVQYGATNVNHRPHFLPERYTTSPTITVHPTIESAEAGIVRFSEVDDITVPRIQFATDRGSMWSYVVDEDVVLAHIDEMIAC